MTDNRHGYKLWSVTAVLLTILGYVMVILEVHSQLRPGGVLNVLWGVFSRTSALVLLVFTVWYLSPMYMDIYLWMRRNFLKDAGAVELVLYISNEFGGKDVPGSNRQKWLGFYPFSLVLFAIGWYFLVFPPTNTSGPLL